MPVGDAMKNVALCACLVCVLLLIRGYDAAASTPTASPSLLHRKLLDSQQQQLMPLIADAQSSLNAIHHKLRERYLLPEFIHVPFLDADAPTSSATQRHHSADCPCQNMSLCEPVKATYEREIFGFQVNAQLWPYYDWTLVTTIVLFGPPLDPALLCYAHDHGVRIIQVANYQKAQLGNATMRASWIKQQVESVTSRFMDGINVDFEDTILNGTAARQQYTQLIADLTTSMHAALPTSQVTVDVAWSPSGIDDRFYDAKGLSDACDFLYIMSYDLRSQIYDLNDCQASANSPILRVRAGLLNYTKSGVPLNKLVLGVPWYSYDYPCLKGTLSDDERCPIRAVPYVGAPCSDAAGDEIDFALAEQLSLHNASTRVRWNDEFQTSYFNYVDQSTQIVHQVWIDDARSLKVKYQLAQTLGLRGVGPYTFDFIAYPPNESTREIWEGMRIVTSKQPLRRHDV